MALVVAAPILTVAGEVFFGAEGAQAGGAYSYGGLWRLFGVGVLTAAGAALVSALAGASLALAGLPRKAGWLAIAGISPLIIPPTVYALGWASIWPAPGTAWLAGIRCAVVMGLAFSPIAALACLSARRLQDPAISESARMAGMVGIRRLLRIEAPGLGAPLLASSSAVFLLSLSQFEIPSALNFNSFPEEIYARFNETYSISASAGTALLAAAPALILGFFLWRHFARSRRGRPAYVARGRIMKEGLAPWAAWGAFLVVAFVWPMAGLAREGFDATAMRAMLPDLVEGLRDTLPVVACAAGLCLALGWATANYAMEHPRAGGMALSVAALPAALSAPVLGIGIILFWNRPEFGNLIYGGSGAWLLALTARFLAIAVLAILAGRSLLGEDFVNSARLAPVPGRLRHWRLLAPALGPLLAGLAALFFALMLGELGATTLLSAPGVELLSFRLHSRLHIGPETHVAALSVMFGATTLALSALIWLIGRFVILPSRTSA